jgi:hypothetical protein
MLPLRLPVRSPPHDLSAIPASLRKRGENVNDCRSGQFIDSLELIICAGLTPHRSASLTSFSRARFTSLASVGKVMFFGCTVVSTMTRLRSDRFIAPVRVVNYRQSKPSRPKDMQHAVASLRHFACKVIPQNIIAIPSTIRHPPTKYLDIRLLRFCRD